MGISLGPWRSMSVFILNVLFAIEKRISFSALSSKMNRRFVFQKAMRIKQDLPTYSITRQFICAPNVRSVKRDAARTRKNPRGWICFIICAPNLIRIAICAGRLRCANIMAHGWSYSILICGRTELEYRPHPYWCSLKGLPGLLRVNHTTTTTTCPSYLECGNILTHRTIRSASPNLKVIAYSFCCYKRKRK